MLFALIELNAQEIQATKFGKGILNLVGKDSSWSMKFGARFQFLATSLMQDGESPKSSFLIRRSRLKFDGFVLNPKFEYRINHLKYIL